jgi:hypothetical protein
MENYSMQRVRRLRLLELRTRNSESGRQPSTSKAGESARPLEARLNIQVFYVQRVLFDELAPGFHVLAHQSAEDGLGFGDVF